MVRNRNDGDYWIGLNDIQVEGSFKWVSSASTPLYMDWSHAGERNDHGGNEDCVELKKFYNYKWNDNDCSTRKYFICGK